MKLWLKMIITAGIILFLLILGFLVFISYKIYYINANTGEYHECTDVTSRAECLDIPCPDKPNWNKYCNYASECQSQNKKVIYNESGKCPYKTCSCSYSFPLM